MEAGYFEKFLFYRGVGKFQLPVTAEFESNQMTMTNDGEMPITSAVFVNVNGGSIQATKINSVGAGDSIVVQSGSTVSQEELADMVQQCLVDEGLYEKEAASMVKTWQQSWFTEDGTRILYMVPQSVTDGLLPLKIKPEPTETLRVLVGRMELMSPSAEQKMIDAVAASSRSREQHTAIQKQQKKPQSYAIPAAIRDFGRMAEPALVRVGKITKDAAIRTEAELLVRQFRK